MSIVKNKILRICALLFVMFHILEASDLAPAILAAYLDDFLCLPLLLSAILLLQQRFIVHNVEFSLPPAQVVFSLIYISILFEIILPNFSEKFNADPFDFFAYAAGALLFYFFINKNLLPATRSI